MIPTIEPKQIYVTSEKKWVPHFTTAQCVEIAKNYAIDIQCAPISVIQKWDKLFKEWENQDGA